MNKTYVHERDNAPCYLNDLRSIGNYAFNEDRLTVIGLSSTDDVARLIVECKECHVDIVSFKQKGRFFEYKISLPFHNYRPNWCLNYDIEPINDALEFFR